MTKIFLIVCLLISFISLGQNEVIQDEFNYKIVYNLNYQLDSTDAESKKNEKMVLYVGDKISRFSSLGTVIGDSLQSSFNSATFSQESLKRMRAQTPKTAFNYHIYKERPAGDISYTENIVTDNFRYTETEDLKWDILSERDSLRGFGVQKATTNFGGREYTAWFTHEIPIPEGPYKFNGLPGLILKIADSKGHYIFEVLEFQKLQKPVPVTFNKKAYITTTQEQLRKMKTEYEQDPIAFMNNQPNVTVTVSYASPGDRERIETERKERLQKKNNPIELE